jgi:hypothetical protein
MTRDQALDVVIATAELWAVASLVPQRFLGCRGGVRQPLFGQFGLNRYAG